MRRTPALFLLAILLAACGAAPAPKPDAIAAQAAQAQAVAVTLTAAARTATLSHTPTPTVPPTPEGGVTRPRDTVGMVYVPAGEFTMGSPEGEGDDSERPQHTVYLDAFWIDRTEVTNAQYRAFMDATGHRLPACDRGRSTYNDRPFKADHPVVCVSWDDASAYCAWAGARLPTEAEWEKAARGTDALVYPWGNNWDVPTVGRCNVWDENNLTGPKDSVVIVDRAQMAPVGSYAEGSSPYGALDMAGNVSEWVSDRYDETYYGISPARNPQGPGWGHYRVMRGGSWWNNSYFVRSAFRNLGEPSFRAWDIGFRCGMSSTSSP